MNIKKYFPVLESLSSHTAKDWRSDVIAGLTVAVMLVPQGMAYALLAGLPPIYGLYGGLIPLFLYAIMGTSRQMSIGPVAISALLVLAGVSQLAEPMSAEYINLVILTGLLVGVAQLLLGVFRLGFLVNFISHPVIIGFTSAAAIIIAVSQLKDLFGIEVPRFTHILDTITYVFQHLSETNGVAVALCLGSIGLMMILKKISAAIPGALIAVIIGSVLVYYFGEMALGVSIVGSVPSGLPEFAIPVLSWEDIRILLPTVFTVTIICVVESIAIAKVLQRKHGSYKIRPNQEMIALGISKIGGAFVQALPTSGSFSRSAVNNEAGAKSGWASIVTAILIGMTLLFLTPLFYYLPKAVLAAIILLSVKGLFEWEEAVELWKTDRNDFFMMLATFVVTLIFGIEEGVMAGVLLSILMVLYKSSMPHIAVLGKLKNSRSYRNVKRFEDSEQISGTMIIRFDEQLYFANAAYFQDEIQELIDENLDGLEMVLLDASNINSVDSTGVHALEAIHRYLNKKNVTFLISGVVGPVRDSLAKTGFMKKLGEKNQFLDVHQAMACYTNNESTKWHPDAIQSNEEVDTFE